MNRNKRCYKVLLKN